MGVSAGTVPFDSLQSVPAILKVSKGGDPTLPDDAWALIRRYQGENSRADLPHRWPRLPQMSTVPFRLARQVVFIRGTAGQIFSPVSSATGGGGPPLGSTLCHYFFSVRWRRLGQFGVTSRRSGQDVTVIRPTTAAIGSDFFVVRTKAFYCGITTTPDFLHARTISIHRDTSYLRISSVFVTPPSRRLRDRTRDL